MFENYLSEKEKMTEGNYYFSQDDELVAARNIARRQLEKINRSFDEIEKNQLVKEIFGSTGNKLTIGDELTVEYGFNIHVGENFECQRQVTFMDVAPITIGSNCHFEPRVQVYTATYPKDPKIRLTGLTSGKAVTLGDNVFVGAGSMILPGVTLGDNVVVQAGSVVSQSFPKNVVVSGNPAVVVENLEAKNSLPVTKEEVIDLSVNETKHPVLKELRQHVDAVDAQLMLLMKERLSYIKEMATYKEKNHLPVESPLREKEILERFEECYSIEDQVIKELSKNVLEISKEYQESLIQKER